MKIDFDREFRPAPPVANVTLSFTVPELRRLNNIVGYARLSDLTPSHRRFGEDFKNRIAEFFHVTQTDQGYIGDELGT